jgi:hypothetical protein
MKYSVICFTFNKKESKEGIEMGMVLRNNWIDEVNTFDDLCDLLESLGFRNHPFMDADKMPILGKTIKLSGDFTVANTKIIVYIIKTN